MRSYFKTCYAILRMPIMQNKRSTYLLLFVQICVFAIPISSFIGVRLLLVALVLSLFLFEFKSALVSISKNSWDIFFYLFIISIGLSYSSDKIFAARTLETSFSLLALPIICFRFSDFNKYKLNNTFLFFSWIASFFPISFRLFFHLLF